MGSGGSNDAIPNFSAFPSLASSKLSEPQLPTNNEEKGKKARDWEIRELKALIYAKKQEFELITHGTSLQKKMASGKSKWKLVAKHVEELGVTNPVRDSDSCKKRWDRLASNFKKIYDYEKNLPNGMLGYFSMRPSYRKRIALPRMYPQELYNEIVSWFPSRQDGDPSDMSLMDSSAVNEETPTNTPHLPETEDPNNKEEEHANEGEEEDPADEDEEELDDEGEPPVGVPTETTPPCRTPHPSLMLPSEATEVSPKGVAGRGLGKRTRKKSSSVARDADLAQIHKTTSELLQILKDDVVRRRMDVEADRELRERLGREQIAMQREVGMAQIEAIKSMTDALVQIVQAKQAPR